MAATIITTEDLYIFKIELIDEIKKIFQTSAPQQKKYLKSYEVRKLLNISPGTLQNLRVNGTLPFTKIGGAIFYDSEDIFQLINENKQNKNY
jgi:hypothetical protein